jgi:hypothetical protein
MFSPNSPTEKSQRPTLSSPLGKIYSKVISMREEERTYLKGRILTLIDGVISDVIQRKAVKDLVNTIFRDKIFFFQELGPLLEGFKNKYSLHHLEKNVAKYSKVSDISEEAGFKFPAEEIGVYPHEDYFIDCLSVLSSDSSSDGEESKVEETK